MLLQVGHIRVPIVLCATPMYSKPEGVPEGKKGEPPMITGDQDDENIPHPTMELYRHTLLRGANVGSLATLVFGVPVLLFRGVRQPAEIIGRLANASVKGVVGVFS